MKKTRNILCVTILAAGLILLGTMLTAFGSEGDLNGTWTLVSVEVNGSAEAGEFARTLAELRQYGGKATMTFREDGQCELALFLRGFRDSICFDYSVRGGRLILSGSEMTYQTDGKTLRLSEGGATLLLEKPD